MSNSSGSKTPPPPSAPPTKAQSPVTPQVRPRPRSSGLSVPALPRTASAVPKNAAAGGLPSAPVRALPGAETVASYSASNPPNPRTTAIGRAQDKQARRISKNTGRDAIHRHSLSGGFPPDDPNNIELGNSLQNRGGGTKHLVEQRRDKLWKSDPSVIVEEKSKLLKNKSGKLLAEKSSYVVIKDGKEVGESSIYFGNFDSSASRYADSQKKAGKPVDPSVIGTLQAKDRQNFKAQNGIASQVQADLAKKRAAGVEFTLPAAVPSKRDFAKAAAARAAGPKKTKVMVKEKGPELTF